MTGWEHPKKQRCSAPLTALNPQPAVFVPPLPSPPGALAALRGATRTRHDRIDRQMDLRRLVEPGRYARVLQVFDAFHASWEAAVADALPAQLAPWLQQRSRRRFLQQDLRSLRLPPLDIDAPRLPLGGPAEAWGSLYVLEGSTLGGQVITRSLATAAITPQHGGAYFHGWGSRTGALWHEFRERLDAALATPEAVAGACAGACLTFDTLSAFLEQALDERPALA